mgnify:FL=1
MKYLITWRIKEPFEENYKRTMEIEDERVKRGEAWGDKMVFPIHTFMSENKAFMIVETDDPMDLAKWTTSYLTVLDYVVEPITDFREIQKLFPK